MCIFQPAPVRYVIFLSYFNFSIKVKLFPNVCLFKNTLYYNIPSINIS